MPLHYSYQASDHSIYVDCYGELTLDHIIQYFRDVEHDDTIPVGAAEAVDLSKITLFDLTHKDVFRMPDAYAPTRAKKQIIGTVTYGATKINGGLSKLIQSYFRKKMPDHFFETTETVIEARELIKRRRTIEDSKAS